MDMDGQMDMDGHGLHGLSQYKKKQRQPINLQPLDERRYGAQIHTLEQLDEAVKRKWSVIIRPKVKGTNPFGLAHRPQPAAWVINKPGALLVLVFAYGLFQYKAVVVPQVRSRNPVS